YTRFRKDFLQRHMDFPKTASSDNNDYCNVMMMRRGMSFPGRCTSRNTFVHTEPADLTSVCTNQPDDSLCTTGQHFPVTVCNLIRSHPTCIYSGNQFNHRVRVKCIGDLPVYLDSTFP
uniref:Ribonuclease A-domain domain-containing protein n=1 Tax=Meleagris gallopavo TaxID=9103 RepID=G1NS85_MELGA